MSVTQKTYTWNKRHGRPDGTRLFLHCATRRRLERDTAPLFINQCSDRRFATGGRLSRHSGLRGQAASKPDGFAFGALRAGARSDKRGTMVWRRLLPCVTIIANGVGAQRRNGHTTAPWSPLRGQGGRGKTCFLAINFTNPAAL